MLNGLNSDTLPLLSAVTLADEGGFVIGIRADGSPCKVRVSDLVPTPPVDPVEEISDATDTEGAETGEAT